MRSVSKELGREMDDAELEECIKDLDTNKDGTISYKEFLAWWLSGRQGLSGWMKRLLAFKLKGSEVIDKAYDTMKDVF